MQWEMAMSQVLCWINTMPAPLLMREPKVDFAALRIFRI